MGSIRSDVVKAVNNRIAHIKQMLSDNHNVTFSMISFDSSNDWNDRNRIRIKQHYRQADVNSIVNFESRQYNPDGGTPLLEATFTAINQLRDSVIIGPEDAILLEVITDGDENTSTILPATLNRAIEKCNQDGYWTITFQVPFGHKTKLLRDFGISADNVMEWEATSHGTHVATQTHNLGFTNYMGERSKGTRALTSYYAAVDLGNLSTKEVKQNLVDVSGNFDEFEVKKEEAIKPFVEKKTGKNYITGSAYYQLSKKETLQPYKKLLVKEKGKNKLYGGTHAREVLGIPENGEVTLDPFNLSSFEIYVESTSVNRLLVRGTNVLVDKYQTTPSPKSTW
jgi:hypothetical protein